MPSDEKYKINVWIPGSLWKQVGSLGYNSPTKATIAAFEALVLQEAKGSNQEVLGSSQEALGSIQEEVRKYQEAIRKHEEIILPNLEKQISELEKRPDPVTFAQLQVKLEGLQEIVREKDKIIERLDSDLIKAGQREEDLKSMHNNYFLQVQTLINQKAIGSPKEEVRKHQEAARKTQEESKPAAQKENKTYAYEVQEVPDIETEKKSKALETICLNCGTSFAAERKTRKFCSGKCKMAYYRKNGK